MEGMETEEVARGRSFLRAPSGDGTRAEGLALNKKTDSSPSPRWRARCKGERKAVQSRSGGNLGPRRLRELTLDSLVAVVLGSKCSHEANEEFRKSGE